jgi:hypothetical protein
MIETDLNHCRIVQDSLASERPIDEQTFDSLAVLCERLERLKKVSKSCTNIEFSPAVEQLKSQGSTVAVA